MGPVPIRLAMLKTFQQHPQLFNRARGQPGKKWKTVYKLEILNPDDYEDAEFDALEEKIRARWQHFLETDLPAINAVVAELRCRGRSFRSWGEVGFREVELQRLRALSDRS